MVASDDEELLPLRGPSQGGGPNNGTNKSDVFNKSSSSTSKPQSHLGPFGQSSYNSNNNGSSSHQSQDVHVYDAQLTGATGNLQYLAGSGAVPPAPSADIVGSQTHHQCKTTSTKVYDPYSPISQVQRVIDWLSLLFNTYGWKLCVVLILSQHVLKGFCFSFLATSLDFVFKFYHVTGPRIQIYKSVALCPWSLKPLFGIISDKFPLFGYHKTSYMVLTTILAIAAMGYVGTLGLLYYDHEKHGVGMDDADTPDSDPDHPSQKGGHIDSPLKDHLDLEMCVLCFFLAFMQISVCDLLTEARYAQSMRDHPELGPDLMSFVWIGISIGGLVGLSSIGYLLSNFGPFIPPLICAGMCSFILVPLSLGYMQETKVVKNEEDNSDISRYVDERYVRGQNGNTNTGGEGVGAALATQDQLVDNSMDEQEHLDSEVVASDGNVVNNDQNNTNNLSDSNSTKRDESIHIPNELVILSLFMGFCALTLVVIGLQKQATVTLNFGVAIVLAFFVMVMFHGLLSPMIAKINFFFFLQTSLAISIEGATFYFFTDSPKAYPRGPHFSTWFYTTGIGLVASLFNILGMVYYNNYLKQWRYHSLFLTANLLHCLFAALGVLVFTRKSKEVFGIPDHLFVLGGALTMSVIHQWLWIPGVVLLSQLCPRHCEATMYALLAGCHNVGNAVGQIGGAFTLERLNIAPKGIHNEQDQFDNLWIAALIQCLLPMITLFMLPYLIPDASQTEKLLKDESDGTDGSWWKVYVMGEGGSSINNQSLASSSSENNNESDNTNTLEGSGAAPSPGPTDRVSSSPLVDQNAQLRQRV